MSRDSVEMNQQKGFYVSPVDRTLTISDVELRNSGLYYCGRKAVFLQVIEATKAPPTPTTLTSTPLLSSTSRQTSEIITPESSTSPPTTTDTTTTQEESKGRKEGNKKHKNKGNKKPKRTTTTTTTTTSTTTTVSSKDKPQILRLVLGTVVFFLLIIVITFVAWRWRFKRLGNEETHPVYDEIQDGVIIQNTNGFGIVKGPTPAYCMTDFTDDPNLNEPTYSTIPDLPPVERRTDTLLPKESP
ncbi:uncharacterized protein LOC134874524 isoform X1 [Eleginops maclovinus]|uniref:uncharacterized protein LOC134874524 isoform X1 n=1 Tax=Eleginops maclovinus TaxID=56733 RepID=UPI003080ED93